MRRTFVSSILLSSLLLPVAAVASQPTAQVPAPKKIRVTTGVVAPTVLYAATVVPPTGIATSTPVPAQVGLNIVVNKDGQAEDIRVIDSLTPAWDASVVAAVRQFRFRPATLDQQAVPMELHLIVNIQR